MEGERGGGGGRLILQEGRQATVHQLGSRGSWDRPRECRGTGRRWGASMNTDAGILAPDKISEKENTDKNISQYTVDLYNACRNQL